MPFLHACFLPRTTRGGGRGGGSITPTFFIDKDTRVPDRERSERFFLPETSIKRVRARARKTEKKKKEKKKETELQVRLRFRGKFPLVSSRSVSSPGRSIRVLPSRVITRAMFVLRGQKAGNNRADNTPRWNSGAASCDFPVVRATTMSRNVPLSLPLRVGR